MEIDSRRASKVRKVKKLLSPALDALYLKKVKGRRVTWYFPRNTLWSS
jgi:hypothetical protein